MESVREVEWFRPLVGNQQWDYVVLWKLGNDPSRFIEWMGCCCSGGCVSSGGDIIVKEEKNDKLLLLSLCRDISLKHSVRTKACESLSKFPSSMDLYSGVHSEVVISRQPRWLNQADDSESISSHDGIGTRAFVPVKGGLIEFYSSKNIPKDQKVLDLILAHCKMVSLEQEATSPSEVLSLDPLPEKCTEKFPSTLDLSLGPSSKTLPPASQSCSRTSIEGPPSIIEDSCNQLLLFEGTSGSKRVEYDKELSRQQDGLVLLGREAEKSAKRGTKRKEKGDYQSKNLLAERERRKRIKNGLLTLRSLVPKITKMDMASILGDAVKYIKDLQMEEMELCGELNEMEEQDCRNRKDGLIIIPESDEAKRSKNCSIPREKTSGSSTFGPKNNPR